ncbi:AsmA family protein [Maridesulfovibrio sp.]|uniref:AsmA family protein n=1 Tax=Maridesulfovibrio sp. TaxID=2795000 RepID=UPI002A18BC6B|nr:AsmA family protein [Maridesulfovibrio sp.]
MGKVSKIAIWIVAGLVTVIAAAMVLATVLIDPNDYKDDISKIVRDKTGRELVFKGDLSLSVFPWIGVRTGGLALSNAKGFEGQDMLSLKSADVSLKLVPLIFGSIELNNIDVADLQLYLMRDKQGKTNWDDLVKAEEASAQAEAATPSDSKETKAEKGGASIPISVAGINIENAQIVWDDRMEDIRQAIDDCDINVNGFAPGDPFTFKIHVAASSTRPEINADINVSGKAELFEDFKKAGVTGLSVVVEASGQAVPGGKGTVKISGDAAFDLLKESADVSGLVLEAYGLRAEGNLKASDLGNKKMKFSGDINVPSFNLKDSLKRMGTPLKTADAKALTSVGMNFNFSGTKSSAEIKDLLVNLDETTVKGLFSIATPDRPNIVAQVDVDSIDVDRYLPPAEKKKAESKSAAEKEGKAEPATEDQGLIPVELLRKLTLKADLSVKSLVASKAKLTDLIIKARAKDGVLTVKPASFNLAKGSFTSSAVVDVRGKLPVISTSASLSGLDGAVLAQDMTGKDSFSGKVDFNTGLNTKGNDLKAIYANLNGKLGFKVLDGYVSGFDMLYLAGDAFSILTGGAFGKRDSKRTEFGEVSATATIKNGVAVNKDLVMQSPLLRAAGQGSLDLNTMKIDYALDAKIVGTLEGQGGKGMDDLIGLTVPFTVTGEVADPSVMVDLPKFTVILAKSGFKIVGSVIEGVGNVLEGIGNTLSGKKSSGTESKDKNPVQELGNTLKKLF